MKSIGQYFKKSLEKYTHKNNSRPALPTRLLVGLHYFKLTYYYSVKGALEHFLENPYC